MLEVIHLNQEWHIGEQLGSGGFGRVHLARSRSDETAAIKIIPKAPGADREILFEDLDGVPNVVPIIDRGEWKDFWVLVMPKAEKSLRDYLSEKTDLCSIDDTVRVLSDITQALVAIEGRVVHRDIKPGNILLLDGRWCLADFGISRYAEATTAPDTRKHAKTPAYAAPEQWHEERASSATDVYSMGIVAYELLAGQVPFMGPEVHEYRRQHLEDTPKSISRVPLRIQSLIDECLYKSPKARPRPQNLLERLESMRRGTQARSEAAYKLQQANLLVVQQQAEAERQQSIARSEWERKSDLLEAADSSLAQIASLLNDRIMEDAPATERSKPWPWSSWRLNEVELNLEPSRMADYETDTNDTNLSFEVAAYSSIWLHLPSVQDGYRGRSHSLWYCDAQKEGVFRWYETAFMMKLLSRESTPFEPLALAPGRDAFFALYRAKHTHQIAWPFNPVDQGNEGTFVEQWIGWFADAVQGQLSRPRSMPERQPWGTWR